MTREEAVERIQQDLDVSKKYLSKEYKEALNMAIEALSADRPSGEWIIEDAHTEHCSVCGYAFHISALFAVGGNDEPNYCPNCGAKMGSDTK